MFGNSRPRIGQELLDVPMGDMIRQMAFAIAEAQIRLDENSIDVAEMMGGLKTITDNSGNVTFEDSRVFFGSEKVSKDDAVEQHNSSKNVLLKNEIRSTLGSNAFVPSIIKKTTLDPLAPPTADPIGTVYDYLGAFYKKTGAATTEVIAYADFQISLKENVVGTSSISLPRRISMMELGFTPTFYQFVDTIIEVKISIKYTSEGESSVSTMRNNKSTSASLGFGFTRIRAGSNVQTSQVNATYSQKYSYSAEGSSLLRTKLVPIPPPAIMEERIRLLMESELGGTTS